MLVCREAIIIGKRTAIGPNTSIYDHDHSLYNDIDDFITEGINIGNDVWIGANVVILKGVTIGDRSVIAAGSVIAQDVEADTLIYQKRDNREKNLA